MSKYLLFTILTFVVFISKSQDEGESIRVKLSTDKVKIEGKYYYIHIVRKGETLYSISQAYNVSQIEIAMENPDIYLGLQPDQALKIPIREIPKGKSDQEKDDDFVYHIVRKRETLFGLARQYGVSMQDIIDANPEVEEGLKVSQTIIIPKKHLDTLGDASPQESERFIYHEVQPREGFFAISQKYGVSQEVIKRFNYDLVKDGIKLGTVLKIPRSPSDTVYSDQPLHAQYKQETEIQTHTTPSTPTRFICDTFTYNPQKNVFNVALLLPFYQDDVREQITDIEGETQTSPQDAEQNTISAGTALFLDFYQGALLAIDSLKKEGFSVNLHVFNSDKKEKTIRPLLNEKGIKDAHLIIGPIYPEAQKSIAEFALENRIPLVSPFSQNSYQLETNPYFLQVTPSFSTQLEEFSKSIELCTGYNIVLLHEEDSTNINLIKNYKEMLRAKISDCRNPNMIHFKEVSYKPGSPAATVQEKISHSLVLDRENLILVPSNNEAFVSDLLGSLHALHTIHKYPISIYGFPRWQRFRNVQLDYYYQLQLHLFAPFFVDYTDSSVKNFIEKYRETFRAEPNSYAFQGYDVMFYFLNALKKYGEEFLYCLPQHRMNLLRSSYHFERNNQKGGLENRTIYNLRYSKNFEISRDRSNTIK